jgi:2-phosphosulfolactate phosphatase
MRLGRTFAVVPAGETWDDSSLRPGIEDLLGAGAVISALRGSRSPEACAATAVFDSFRSRLHDVLRACSSGKELIERGFDADVDLAAELDTSLSVARLLGPEIRSMV